MLIRQFFRPVVHIVLKPQEKLPNWAEKLHRQMSHLILRMELCCNCLKKKLFSIIMLHNSDVETFLPIPIVFKNNIRIELIYVIGS